MAVVGMVRAAAGSLTFLVCVDGLASYVTAFTRVFRDPDARAGEAGRDWWRSPGCCWAR